MYGVLAKSFMYPSRDRLSFLSKGTLRHLANDSRSSVEIERVLSGVRDSAELEAEHTRLFAHIAATKCPPYETEYGWDNIFQKTEAMADIAGFYRAYGLETANANAERVDFLGTELEFMSYLTANEAYARQHRREEHLKTCVDTQQKFVRDHLGRWVHVFAKILGNSTKNEFYLCLANLVEKFVESEIGYLNVSPLRVSGPSKDADKTPGEFSCDSCVPVARGQS